MAIFGHVPIQPGSRPSLTCRTTLRSNSACGISLQWLDRSASTTSRWPVFSSRRTCRIASSAPRPPAVDPRGGTLPRLRAGLNPLPAVFAIHAVSARLTARSQLLASCAYLCTGARSTGEARLCRRRGVAFFRELRSEEGRRHGDWLEPTSPDLGSEALDVVACGTFGRGRPSAPCVAGSEAGGSVREDVPLPGSCRRAAAGTSEGRRCSFAWARA